MSNIIKHEKLVLNGITYVPQSTISDNAPSKDLDGKKYVVIRSRDSGCHAGYLESEDGTTITLINARRLWYWSGANSLSQLAMDGVGNPSECKFPCAVDSITVYSVCEKISTTSKAQESI